MKTASLALATVVALVAAPALTAQNVQQTRKVDGVLQVQKAPFTGQGQVLDQTSQKSSSTIIYNNTFTNGWYSAWGLGIWFDWGTVTSFDNSATATHHCVTSVDLGYGTHLATGGTQALIWYAFDGSTGWCSANGIGTFVFGVYVYGLPGTYPTWPATGWTFSIPLENIGGAGVSACFEQAEGPIGYGFDFLDDNNAGPLLVGRPNPTGDQDVFDFYDSTGQTCLGSYWFGGYSSTNPFASFYTAYNAWQSWAQPFGSGGACADSCGGVWSLDGSGCTCDGSTVSMTIATSAGSAAAGSAMALVAGLGGAATIATFATGCTFDTLPPYITIQPLGPAGGGTLPLGSIPAGSPGGVAVTFQILVKDSGVGCGTGGTVSTNPLQMITF